MSLPFDAAIRALNREEKIPYDLLLLADETEDAVNKYIDKCEVYVLEHANQVTAVYALQIIDAEAAEIKNIAVAKNFQGQGIGNLLLTDAARRAKERGCTELIVGTADAAVDLLHFYQKAGFEMADIRKNFFLENYPAPIYQDGVRLKHMVVLRKGL